MPNTPDVRLAILETKQDSQDEWRAKTDDTLAEIAKALQMLARVDLQNEGLTRQVSELRVELTGQSGRLTRVEAAMPALVSTKNTVMDLAKQAGKLAFTAAIAALLLHFGLKVPGL